MTNTARTRIIASLLAMFNAEHELSESPAWLIELHNTSDDVTLLARLANWQQNYPQHFTAHGIYVM